MLINLDYVCCIKPIAKHIDGESSLEEFVESLNDWIHGLGDWGYEQAEKANLITEKKYDVETAKKLIEMVKVSKGLSKDSLYIKEIDEVPYGMAMQLAEETHGGSYAASKARVFDVAYGVMHGHELVAFVSAKEGEFISIGGLYVNKSYRGKGLSTKLLDCMMRKAERDGKKGLWMGNASWDGQDALKRLFRKYESQGKDVEFEMFSEDFSNKAGLYFKERI